MKVHRHAYHPGRLPALRGWAGCRGLVVQASLGGRQLEVVLPTRRFEGRSRAFCLWLPKWMGARK